MADNKVEVKTEKTETPLSTAEEKVPVDPFSSVVQKEGISETEKGVRTGRYLLIKEMPRRQIRGLCTQIIQALQAVEKGHSYSKRHDMFKKGDSEHHALNQIAVCEPFTFAQELEVFLEITSHILARRDQQEILIPYLRLVLIPEALIMIYAMINWMPFDKAEDEMMAARTCD